MKFEESETVELKKSLSELKQGLISIVAILNKHQSGTLWFGLHNDGAIAGADDNEKTLRDLSQAIAAHIEPKIYPHITLELLQGKTCIKVVFSGKEAPYFAYGKAWMRVADEDRQLSARELEQLILTKHRELLRWDSEPSGTPLVDIDPDKLKRFVERAGLTWSNVPEALEKLGVLKNGQLLNAARLFFANSPGLQLRCAVFGGTTSAMIIDRHDFEGDLLVLIEEAQKYLLKNILIGMRLKGLEREDMPEISPEAMREAIINAFCHRDYRDPDHVQIAVFKNRVEIRSPGGLFEGLTIEELIQGNISKRRNPLVAELLRRVHLVEAWGRGVPLILGKEPGVEFREIANLFITSFTRPSFIQTTEETTSGTTDKTLSTIEKAILSLIKANPTLTQRDMATYLSLTEDGVRYHTDKLKAKGMLRRIGGKNRALGNARW